MTTPNRYFDSVQEAYIDLLLLEEFWSSAPFRSWWLEQVAFPNPDRHEFVTAQHSVIDAEGESDLVFEVNDEAGIRWAILIEDKVDAGAQPRQGERYRERGERGVLEDKWDRFVTCIVARESYLAEQPDARQYDHRISLESIRDVLATSDIETERRSYKIGVLDAAIDPTYAGYVKKVDEGVTAFLERYAGLAADLHELRIKSPLTGGPRSVWIYFDVGVKGVDLIHKATKGFVDLQIQPHIMSREELHRLGTTLLEGDMSLAETGKSTSIRLMVRPFDKLSETDDTVIRSALEGARRLLALSRQIEALGDA